MAFVLRRYIGTGGIVAIVTFIGFVCILCLFRKNSKKYLKEETQKLDEQKHRASNAKRKQFIEQELGVNLPKDAKANIIFVNVQPGPPPPYDQAGPSNYNLGKSNNPAASAHNQRARY